MRAIVLRKGEHQPRLVDHPEPEPRQGEALVKTLFAGMDGTDNEVLQGDHGQFPAGRDEMVLGHECLGEVIDAPEGSGLKRGDHVVPLVRHGCGQCKACGSHPDFCPTGNYREHGIKGLDGFYRDMWTDDASSLVKAPKGIGPLAVLTEPLSISVKAYEEARRLQRRIPWFEEDDEFRGKRALFAGTGSLGTLGCFLLVSEGMEVWAMDREQKDAAPASLLKGLGVNHINARQEHVTDVAKRLGGFDLVIEGTGVPEVAFTCMQTLAGNGIMAMLGVPKAEKPFPVEGADIMHRMVMKNQAILGSVNSGRRDFEIAMRRLAEFRSRWPKETEGIITTMMDPDGPQAAYDIRGPEIIKKVFRWSEGADARGREAARAASPRR